jgi:hypothetical protein
VSNLPTIKDVKAFTTLDDVQLFPLAETRLPFFIDAVPISAVINTPRVDIADGGHLLATYCIRPAADYLIS